MDAARSVESCGTPHFCGGCKCHCRAEWQSPESTCSPSLNSRDSCSRRPFSRRSRLPSPKGSSRCAHSLHIVLIGTPMSEIMPLIYVAIVDDDESVCRSFGRLLTAAGFQPVMYPSAESFLRDTKHPRFGCLCVRHPAGCHDWH